MRTSSSRLWTTDYENRARTPVSSTTASGNRAFCPPGLHAVTAPQSRGTKSDAVLSRPVPPSAECQQTHRNASLAGDMPCSRAVPR